MYTLGAALGVIVVYALLRIGQGTGDRGRGQGPGVRDQGQGLMVGWWAVYAVAAAAGMYTLYYFVFLLIPLNLWVLWQIANSKWRMAPSGGKWQMAGQRASLPPPSQNPASTPAAQTSSFQLPASSFQPGSLPISPPHCCTHRGYRSPTGRRRTRLSRRGGRRPISWHALRESWTALSLGQSAPSWLWPALLLTLGLYGLGLFAL